MWTNPHSAVWTNGSRVITLHSLQMSVSLGLLFSFPSTRASVLFAQKVLSAEMWNTGGTRPPAAAHPGSVLILLPPLAVSAFPGWKMSQGYTIWHMFNGDLVMTGRKHNTGRNLSLVLDGANFRTERPWPRPSLWGSLLDHLLPTWAKCLSPVNLLQRRLLWSSSLCLESLALMRG